MEYQLVQKYFISTYKKTRSSIPRIAKTFLLLKIRIKLNGQSWRPISIISRFTQLTLHYSIHLHSSETHLKFGLKTLFHILKKFIFVIIFSSDRKNSTNLLRRTSTGKVLSTIILKVLVNPVTHSLLEIQLSPLKGY